MDDDARHIHIHLGTLEPGVHVHIHVGTPGDEADGELTIEPTSEPTAEAMLKRLMDYGNADNVQAMYKGLLHLGLTPHVPTTRKNNAKMQPYLRWTHGESGPSVLYLNAASAIFAGKADVDRVGGLPGAIRGREVRFPIRTREGVQHALAAVKLVIS